MTGIFYAVLQRSAASCLVILAVLAARMLFFRLPKGYRCLLWLAVLFRLLCPVSVQSSFSLSAVTDMALRCVRSVSGVSSIINMSAHTSLDQALTEDTMPGADGQTEGQKKTKQTDGQKKTEQTDGQKLSSEDGQKAAVFFKEHGHAKDMLMFCWLAGMAVMTACSLIRLLLLMRRLRGAEFTGYLSQYLDKKLPFYLAKVRVLRVKNLETAFVLGIFRPCIYVPFDTALETERYILAHEMVHVRRGDFLWRLLGLAALILYWFHPLVQAAWVLSSRDMEMSCDEAAVRFLGADAKKGYSAALLSAAAGKRILTGRTPAFGKGDISMRIKNVLYYKKLPHRTAAAAFVTVLAFCAFLAADAPKSSETANTIKAEDTGKTMKTESSSQESDMTDKSRIWQADLTHDKRAETIRLDLYGLQNKGFADFTVESDGVLLYSDTVSFSHAGWRTYALYQDETGAYLLQYQPYFGQSTGQYSYELFCFDTSGRRVREEGSVSFSAGMPYAAPDNDIDALTDFTDEVNALWEHSVLLVTTDQNVLAGLYDAEGVRARAGEHDYAAPDILDEQLHYVEQMSWTEIMLEGRETEGADLRTRLEMVNQVLAEHREE